MKVARLKQVRLKSCKGCRQKFQPANTLQVACSVLCAQVVAKRAIDREKVVAERGRRLDLARRREAIKTRSERMKEAQVAFNAYIRERDIALPCICCGGFAKNIGSPGGSWDAGHFLSVGSHPELRFDPDNCHKQLKSCNAGSGKWARKGRIVSEQYRERLIEKIGLDRVLRLEGPHEQKKYTAAELADIKRHYTSLRRNLEKDRI